MLFSLKLENEIYAPWREHYINYELLKKFLKESVYYQPNSKKVSHKKTDDSWTEKNESEFVHQLDLELEKVYSFQSEEYKRIDSEISKLENMIDDNLSAGGENVSEFLKTFDYKSFQLKLEENLNLARELDHFARINFTGFVKIVKKHDRLHSNYAVEPLLNVRLNELPFHSEDYSPLLYKLSFLYSFLRENYQNNNQSSSLNSMTLNSVNSKKAISTASDIKKTYKTFKFWIHPENLMEVKTKILRHLPVLIYNNSLFSDNNFDTVMDDSNENDSIITSLYFDNSDFELYNSKLQKDFKSPTLRLRWSGRLIEKPPIFLEKKLFNVQQFSTEDTTQTTENDSTESENLVSLQIKEKYIDSFIFDDSENTVNKLAKKLTKRPEDAVELKKKLESLKNFVDEKDLEPTLRCIYTRTAFQIPGDDRVRIIIDSDILFIREDSFDKFRPIRDPQKWHRTDIDSNIENPYSLLRKGEFTKFPYSVMEITVQDKFDSTTIGAEPQTPNTTSLSQDASKSSNSNKIKLSFTRKSGKWIDELTSSHLVKEVPNFSKFIQGIASLYTEDDKLDILPFWLPDLEKDIRKNPEEAYDEELKKMQKRKQSISLLSKINSLTPDKNESANERNRSIKKLLKERKNRHADLENYDSSDEDDDDEYEDSDLELESDRVDFNDDLADNSTDAFGINNNRTVVSNESFSQGDSSNWLTSNRGKLTDTENARLAGIESEDEELILPPGVKEPKQYLKNAGPVKVETKVWLANERTFLRWLHTAALLFVFTSSIQASVGKSNYPDLMKLLSSLYFIVTLFILCWGYFIYRERLTIIRERDGRHLDNVVGPLVISASLLLILVINFTLGLQKSAASHQLRSYMKETEGFAKNYYIFFASMAGADLEELV